MLKCGTSCGTFPKKPFENRHTPLERNLAEPFPTHFTRTRNYMKIMRLSGICRFRRFRLFWAFARLDGMCGKRFRRFRSGPFSRPSAQGE
jgi:hypothetical protein